MYLNEDSELALLQHHNTQVELWLKNDNKKCNASAQETGGIN